LDLEPDSARICRTEELAQVPHLDARLGHDLDSGLPGNISSECFAGLESQAFDYVFDGYAVPNCEGVEPPGRATVVRDLSVSACCDSVLWHASRAVALATVEPQYPADRQILTISWYHYCRALHRLQLLVNRTHGLVDGRVLAAISLIDSFEVRPGSLLGKFPCVLTRLSLQGSLCLPHISS
jgi:hypothetical protein